MDTCETLVSAQSRLVHFKLGLGQITELLQGLCRFGSFWSFGVSLHPNISVYCVCVLFDEMISLSLSDHAIPSFTHAVGALRVADFEKKHDFVWRCLPARNRLQSQIMSNILFNLTRKQPGLAECGGLLRQVSDLSLGLFDLCPQPSSFSRSEEGTPIAFLHWLRLTAIRDLFEPNPRPPISLTLLLSDPA